MELPENAVAMPAEQRAELKRLAELCTPGKWSVHPDKGGDNAGLILSDGEEPIAQVYGNTYSEERSEEYSEYDAAYIAAVSPDVALATLVYVEALEAEVATLGAEIEAYKLIHQGMQTKFHAILRQVMTPLPDFDEAVERGLAMQRAGVTAETPILNCEPGCIACTPPASHPAAPVSAAAGGEEGGERG